MCAIFGYSGFQDKNLITKMSQDQNFRGPDYFNYFTDNKVTVGNNRLSIIDVQNGSQPIFSEDKKLSKVGNKVNVTIKEVNNPKVIIQPKSIMGLISLKIRDRNAQIVVSTV